jgi:hypothetical protein
VLRLNPRRKTTVGHIILLGDSIFDNERYVPGGPSVIEHLRRGLPAPWKATLLAFDGAVTSDVARQLARLPAGCTHLVVSVGGNDALESGLSLLREYAGSVTAALSRIADVRDQFQINYRQMLDGVLRQGKPAIVCTVYDSVPGLGREERTALCFFNDVILREAFHVGLPVIDLRLICNEPGDYATSSPIEPSAAGGGKIARAVRRAVTDPDFAALSSRVFGRA